MQKKYVFEPLSLFLDKFTFKLIFSKIWKMAEIKKIGQKSKNPVLSWTFKVEENNVCKDQILIFSLGGSNIKPTSRGLTHFVDWEWIALQNKSLNPQKLLSN